MLDASSTVNGKPVSAKVENRTLLVSLLRDQLGVGRDLAAVRNNGEAVDPIAQSVDGPIEDIHGTPEYRAHLTRVPARRAVQAAG